jgi:hypothetical protein
MEANQLDLRSIFLIWRHKSKLIIKEAKKFKIKKQNNKARISIKKSIKIQVPVLNFVVKQIQKIKFYINLKLTSYFINITNFSLIIYC